MIPIVRTSTWLWPETNSPSKNFRPTKSGPTSCSARGSVLWTADVNESSNANRIVIEAETMNANRSKRSEGRDKSRNSN